MFKSEVFNRSTTNAKIINNHLYNFIIGLSLFWGFAVNWFMVETIPVSAIMEINPWIFFIGYFASCLIGFFLFNGSDNPIVSFIGYNFVVVPFGLVLTVALQNYTEGTIIQAIQITTIITVTMMVLGTLFPAFFQGIAPALTIALLVSIIVELVMIFVFGFKAPIMDWIVILIFCGYVGFDWGRANMIPKTVDNAIDSSAALYMDIINIFIRVAAILGGKK